MLLFPNSRGVQYLVNVTDVRNINSSDRFPIKRSSTRSIDDHPSGQDSH